MEEIGNTLAMLRAEVADLHEKYKNLCAIHEQEKQEYLLAVEKLHQSELKYSTIFENVQDVFYQTDLKGIVHEISPSIKYFTDFNSEELVGRPVYEIYADPSEREQLLERLAQKGEIRDYEIKIKSKNGTIKFVSINARLIFDE